MMHSLNSTSSPSNQQKKAVSLAKPPSSKTSGDVNTGMVVKDAKPHVFPSDTNSNYKHKNVESRSVPKLNFPPHPIKKCANLDKRKEIKSDSPIQKKFKSEAATLQNKELSQGLATKQYNKFKSVCPKTYICKFCCRRFYTEEQLQQHTKIHGNKTSHICYLCNHQTASFSALMTHYLKHSGPKGNKLEKIYAKSKADYTNIQFNRPKPLFRCPKCKLSFNVKSKFDSHTCPSSLVQSVYTCAYCGRVSSTVEEYRNCVQSHTETPFVCVHCKTKFQRKKHLDSHLEHCKPNSKTTKDYKCDKCTTFVCKSKKELETHLVSCENSSVNFVCKNCNSEFCEKKNYDTHLLQCKAVDKSIEIKVEPKKPRKYVKKKIKYTCSSCNAPFFLKAEFKKHEKSCLTVIPYDANESASKTCSKCRCLIEIAKFSEHMKICSSKMKIEEKMTRAPENDCSDKIMTEMKSDNAVTGSIRSNKSETETKSENAAVENICTNKSKTNKSAVAEKISSNKSKTNKSAVAEKISSNRSKTEAKPKNPTLENASFNQNIPVQKKKKNYKKNKLNKNCETVEKSPTTEKGPLANESNISMKTNIADATRRSTRLVRRKSNFIDDDDDEVEKKKKKSIKIKLPKKPKVILKPKFRRGKNTDGKNSFLCNICDFSFCSKSTLLRHKRMHSGNPWYTCQYCGKFFFRKDVYIRHEVNVHRDYAKAVYCCCYCKLCFKEAPALKDHVMEVHKDSAFLPIRPRFSRKRSSDTGDIKLEFEDMEANDASDLIETEPACKKGMNEYMSSFSTDPTYKCSLCPQMFETASETALHMDIHSETLNDKDVYTSKTIEKDPVTESAFNVKESTYLSLNQDAPLCESTLSAPNSKKLIKSSSDQTKDKAVNLSSSVPEELITDQNIIVVETLQCVICSEIFSDKTLLEAHEKTMHKLVDWFQCLVCSASGPKTDMIEHMFSHMFKVGTFVVNNNNRNFDAILSCLQLDQQDSAIEKETTVCRDKQNPANKSDWSSEVTNLVSDEELPPLREFGVCSCMGTKCYQDKMPDLQRETDLVKEQNISNLEQNLDRFNSSTDELHASNMCETGITKTLPTTDVMTTDENIISQVVISEDKRSEQEMCNISITKDTGTEMNASDILSSKRNDLESAEVNVSSLQKEKVLCNDASNASSSVNKAPSCKGLDSYNILSPDGKIEINSSEEEETGNVEIDSSDASSAEDKEEENKEMNTFDAPFSENKEIDTFDAPISEKAENKGIYSSDASSSSDDEEIEDKEILLDAASSEKEEADNQEIDSSDDSSSEDEDENNVASSSDASEEENENKALQSSSVSSSGEEEENKVVSSSDDSSSEEEETEDKLTHSSDNSSSEKNEMHTSDALSVEEKEVGNKNQYLSKILLSEQKESGTEDTNVLNVSYTKEKEANKEDFILPNISTLEIERNSKNINILNTSHPKEKEVNKRESMLSNVSSSTERKGNSKEMHSSSILYPKEKEKIMLSPIIPHRTITHLSPFNVPYFEQKEAKHGELSLSSVSEDKELKCEDIQSSYNSFSERKVTNKQDMHVPDSLFSSQVKEQSSNLPSEENVGDNPTESFSQLRYLLQKPSKMNCEKITIYPFSHMDAAGETSDPFVKCVSTAENQSLGLVSDYKYNFNLPNQNTSSFNELRYGVQIPPNPNQNTCLKLDINQSRSVVSGNQNPRSSNKTENLFKSCPSQSAILDFSDLIQHSFENSSPVEDNIFSYTTPLKTVDFLSSDISNREEVRTPDCTDMVDYDSSTFNTNVKCNNCNAVLENNSELANHKCLSAKHVVKCAEPNSLFKSKNTFQSLQYVENQNKVPSVTTIQTFQEKYHKVPTITTTNSFPEKFIENQHEVPCVATTHTFQEKFVDNQHKVPCVTATHAFQEKHVESQHKVPCVTTHIFQDKFSVPNIYKPAESFVSSKVLSSEPEVDRYRKTLPHQNVPPQTSSKCNKCQRTFSDIGELMKHSLTCLKSLFYRNSQANDCTTTTGTLHSLLLKDPNATFSDFSLQSSMLVNTILPESARQNFEELKRSFDS